MECWYISFRAKDIISAFEQYNGKILSLVSKAVESIEIDIGFCRLDPASWAKIDKVSIDHAIMEKASNISVVPFDGCWSDLGDWYSVWSESAKDTNGVYASSEATAIDCVNTLLRSESERLEVVGIGLDNIVAIAMNDAVLVADMSRAQDVKNAVDYLKSKKSTQATTFPKDLSLEAG